MDEKDAESVLFSILEGCRDVSSPARGARSSEEKSFELSFFYDTPVCMLFFAVVPLNSDTAFLKSASSSKSAFSNSL